MLSENGRFPLKLCMPLSIRENAFSVLQQLLAQRYKFSLKHAVYCHGVHSVSVQDAGKYDVGIHDVGMHDAAMNKKKH
jgi:hypothetical protein